MYNLMAFIYRIFCIFILGFPFCFGDNDKKSGSYVIKVTNFEACNNTGENEIALNVVTEYKNGEEDHPCFTGNLTVNKEINDELNTIINVDFWENEAWKKHFTNLHFKNSCSNLKTFESNWFKLLNQLNVNVTDCPIPKGVYNFQCVDFAGMEFKSQSSLKYGRYRLTNLWRDKETLIGCYHLEGIAIPAQQ